MFRYGLLRLPSFVVLSIAIIHAAAASAPATPAYQLQSPLGFSSPDNWQKYIRSPSTQIIHPVSIISNYTQGNVTNPEGLLAGHGIITLTRPAPGSNGSSAAETMPTIVLDFGQNIVGYLSIKFGGAYNSTPGLPGIRLAFSESIQYGYLTDVSDFSRSDNASF